MYWNCNLTYWYKDEDRGLVEASSSDDSVYYSVKDTQNDGTKKERLERKG